MVMKQKRRVLKSKSIVFLQQNNAMRAITHLSTTISQKVTVEIKNGFHHRIPEIIMKTTMYDSNV